MSASEKLKALETKPREQTRVLLDFALPQIVAVVANAELVSKVLGPTPMLDAALAALDEALP